MLAGPATIGFIAHLSSLPLAFIMVTVLLLAVVALSRRVRM
ncbi:hypothetical protein [Kalamiella sp. sgz302252]